MTTDELNRLPIEGQNLTAPTWGGQLGRGRTLVCFLRHFG